MCSKNWPENWGHHTGFWLGGAAGPVAGRLERCPEGQRGRTPVGATRLLMLLLVCALAWGGGLQAADTDKGARVGGASGASEEATASKPKARAKKASEPWDAAKAAEEFRRLQFELALAGQGGVYMVIDADRRQILLKMKGTVVWNTHMEIAPEDSAALGAFARRFAGEDDRLIRMLASKHLFTAKEKTPDSILAIVGQVVKADPQLLQRDIPERFELKWGWDLILDVRADVDGEPRSRLRNLGVSLIDAVRQPFGAARLKVRLASDDALTLYRAVTPGMPTLFYSSR